MRTGLVALRVSLAVLWGATCACASGGDDSSPGGDGSVPPPFDGSVDAPREGTAPRDGASDGGGGDAAVTLTQACNDNATAYCTQLAMCSPYLMSTEYGDTATCESRLGYCLDIVTAKGTGWTADGLEACVKARSKLSCQQFLYERPAPAACTPTGTLKADATCLYDTQCATGYCKLTSAGACGTCVALGGSGAACTSSNDCEQTLVCSGSGLCTKPVGAGAACSATTPCALGLDCAGGACAKPVAVGAACGADGGAPCDPAAGAYCSGTTCAALSVVKTSDPCGGATNAVCYGGATCLAGSCQGPVKDGKACDGGIACQTPSTCNVGVCGLFGASNCK